MTDRMLQFFKWDHLRPDLQTISKPFGELAQLIVEKLPSNPERSMGLRKLLEAKDCAVRASIEGAIPPQTPPPSDGGYVRKAG